MSDIELEGQTRFRVTEKWGNLVSGGRRGFQAVPDLLFRHQDELGITNTEMVVLLTVLMHWWRADDMPHPTVHTIAKRMGSTERSVQRALAGLKRKGLIADLKASQSGQGREHYFRKFDVSLLVRALERAEFDVKEPENWPGDPERLFASIAEDAPSQRLEHSAGDGATDR